MMDSYIVALALALFVIMLVRLRKKDYAVGCARFREADCSNPDYGKCSFPDCDNARKYKTKKFFVL